MEFRALTFPHRADFDLVRRGHAAGFNAVVKPGSMVLREPGWAAAETSERALLGTGANMDTAAEVRNGGLFELADELGMQTAIWRTELSGYQPASWGEITVENDRFWEAIRSRYRSLLTDLFPDLDVLLLKVSESEVWLSDPEILHRLVTTVHDVCCETDTDLLFRTFTWHPEEAELLRKVIEDLPTDIGVQTKATPQDWNLRGIDHPFIGAFDDRTQIVEDDVAGEYYRADHLTNCFPDALERRLDHWQGSGCEGFCIRVNWQRPSGGPSLTERPFGLTDEPDVVNVDALGRLSTGDSSLDAIWQDVATDLVGTDAAADLIEAMRPSGSITAEALCVGRESFGDTRKAIPAIWTFDHEETATVRTDAEATDIHDGIAHEIPDPVNPFARPWSTWRWDESFLPEYHRLRTGHPVVIDEKVAGYGDALDEATHALDIVDGIRGDLEDDGTYLRFKLAETRFHLQVMCEAELAWLKAANALYAETGRVERWTGDRSVDDHLDTLLELDARTGPDGESVSCDWRGTHYEIERGEYIDPAGYVDRFRRYWQV